MSPLNLASLFFVPWQNHKIDTQRESTLHLVLRLRNGKPPISNFLQVLKLISSTKEKYEIDKSEAIKIVENALKNAKEVYPNYSFEDQLKFAETII